MSALVSALRSTRSGQLLISARHRFLFSQTMLDATDAWVRIAQKNRIKLRGHHFDVSSPLVTKWIKSQLFWGFYEKAESRLIARYLDPGRDVIELGASIGVVTSRIATALEPSARVIAVEADARLLPLLRRSLAENGVASRVQIVHGAIHYGAEPEVWIAHGENNCAGRVGEAGASRGAMVESVTLSALVERHGIGNYTLVADIEGAELGIIEQDAAALARCDTVIIELHDTCDKRGHVSVGELAERWAALGYDLRERVSDVFVFQRSAGDAR